MSHTHRFDPVSGWCDTCSLRDDGRLMSFAGDEWRPGPDYTPEQLQQFLQQTGPLT
jgi:hypothetical protein